MKVKATQLVTVKKVDSPGKSKGGHNLEVVLVPIADLRPNEYNPRQITKKQRAELEKSLREFGMVEPVVCNRAKDRMNVVIGGHQRLAVLKEMGWDDAPVVYVSLTLARERQLNLRLNRNLGQWDWDLLANFDLEELRLAGFDEDELAKELDLAGGVDEDVAPEPPDEPVTKVGDLIVLGDHRVLCGNCVIPEDVKRLADGAAADLVFTDPPYGVGYVGGTKDALTIENDRLGDESTQRLIADSFALAPLRPGGSFYVCSPSGDKETVFRMAFLGTEFVLHQAIAWVKDSLVLGRSDYHYQHETLLYGWREGSAHQFFGGRKQSTVWNIARPKASPEHPTMKPIALCARAIQNSSMPGQVVWDGFAGSGSTLIACEQLGRVCLAMEIDPRYCDVIVQRWEAYTGRSAVRP